MSLHYDRSRNPRFIEKTGDPQLTLYYQYVPYINTDSGNCSHWNLTAKGDCLLVYQQFCALKQNLSLLLPTKLSLGVNLNLKNRTEVCGNFFFLNFSPCCAVSIWRCTWLVSVRDHSHICIQYFLPIHCRWFIRVVYNTYIRFSVNFHQKYHIYITNCNHISRILWIKSSLLLASFERLKFGLSTFLHHGFLSFSIRRSGRYIGIQIQLT